MSEEKNEKKITKNMTIGDVVQKFPETVPVMLAKGLHCVGCHVAGMETLEQGVLAHGLTEKDLEEMLEEMNKATEKDEKKE